MPKKLVLSKIIINQLSSEEKKKLKKMEKEDAITIEKMLNAQSAYTQYIRKTKDSISSKARKLADKGFKYECMAFKSHDKLVKYKELLKKKYSKKFNNT
jgi:hypothetical protein